MKKYKKLLRTVRDFLGLTRFNFYSTILPLITLSVVSLHSNAALAQTLLNIDFDKQYQEIDGFGASDAWSIDPTIKKWVTEGKEADINKLADLLFSPSQGIGLSAWRFNVGAGSAEQGSGSKINDTYRRAELFVAQPDAALDPTKQAGQVRFLKEAYARGVNNFVVFANSPPTWATKNGLAHPGNGTGVGSTNLKADQVDNYSKFLVKVIAYLRTTVGVPVNYVSPINEPTWDWQGQSQEANRYNNSDMKLVYRSLASALKNQNLKDAVSIDGVEAVEYTATLSDATKIQFDKSAYSSGMNGKGYGSYKNYIDDFLGDNELKGILGNKLSMHGYWSDSWPDRLGQLRDLTWQNTRAVSPDAKIWMSEYSILGDATTTRPFNGNGFAPDDMVFALHVAKVIHRDLTRLNASAWHWWLAVTPYDYKDGLVKINNGLDASSVQPSKMMWSLGNFSRFIRPGYVRIDLPGADNLAGVLASAYKSPDAKKLVVVAINASAQAQNITFNLDHLPVGKTANSFDIYITNATKNLELVGSTEKNYTLPSASVLTFVANVSGANESSSSSQASSASSSLVSSSNSSQTSSASSMQASSATTTSTTPNSSSGSGRLDMTFLMTSLIFSLLSVVLGRSRAKF
jgi:O-glycosyl hydrolase